MPPSTRGWRLDRNDCTFQRLRATQATTAISEIKPNHTAFKPTTNSRPTNTVSSASYVVAMPSRMTIEARRTVGNSGEDFALAHLRRLGFSLVARKYLTRRGEIDLIVCDAHTLVFVEVKTRVAWASEVHLQARCAEWFSSRQRARQRAVAIAWLNDPHRPRLLPPDIRFDVIGILVSRTGALLDLDHIEGIS